MVSLLVLHSVLCVVHKIEVFSTHLNMESKFCHSEMKNIRCSTGANSNRAFLMSVGLFEVLF